MGCSPYSQNLMILRSKLWLSLTQTLCLHINKKPSLIFNFISSHTEVFLFSIHQYLNVMTTKTGIIAALMTFIGFFIQAETNEHSLNNTKAYLLTDSPTNTKAITPTAHRSNSHMIKVALLLDTSNSMDGLIDQAKAQLWELVNELSYAKCSDDAKPGLQIALYEYGNDRLNAREGYIRQVLAFSNDLDEISKQLFKLTTNGGNEYCGKVIQTSLNQLDWGKDKNDLNLIFIAGNEPFDQGPTRYQDAATNACEQDVTINTIFCGDYNQGMQTHWKSGADLSHGDYIAINHDKHTVHIPSPYDDAILKKNKALNKTYVTYGRQGRAKQQEQITQDLNASSYGNANEVKRTISKSSHFYKNKSWDLVDAAEDDDFEYDQISNLPKELENKSPEEVKAYVDKKRTERIQIQEEIAALNKKRLAYIAKQSTDEDNELRNAMIKAIKKQAERKSYQW